MIEIDGAQGEGGGQVLRSSLALSMLTGQTLQIRNIRSRRTRPGLLPQHLRAVDAAAAISRARVEGASLGSKFLSFEPGEIRSGRYRFDIGTAGSTSLVLQTIFVPLSLARSSSSVIITGGTHVPHAPCSHYLEQQWLFWMRRIGYNASLTLDQAGFYPQGGGRITATVRPIGRLLPLILPDRGPLMSIHGLSAVSNLDLSIANRQKRQALLRLEASHLEAKIRTLELPSPGKGTLLLLLAEFGLLMGDSGREAVEEGDSDYSQCCYYSLGEQGKPAERVADEAVDGFFAFLESGGAVDQYLADQLLLPLSFADGFSEFRTSQITGHLLTNAQIIQAFLPTRIEIDGEPGQAGLVRVIPG